MASASSKRAVYAATGRTVARHNLTGLTLRSVGNAQFGYATDVRRPSSKNKKDVPNVYYLVSQCRSHRKSVYTDRLLAKISMKPGASVRTCSTAGKWQLRLCNQPGSERKPSAQVECLK